MNEVLFDLSENKNEKAPDIVALFLSLNQEFFNNELPIFPILWDYKLRVTAGKIRFSSKNNIRKIVFIKLNFNLFKDNNWDISKIKRTLIHEMVHAYLYLKYNIKGHGIEFQTKMNEILGERDSHTYHQYDVSSKRNKRRNIILEFCEECQKVIGQRKRKPSYHIIDHMIHPECGGKVTFHRTKLNN